MLPLEGLIVVSVEQAVANLTIRRDKPEYFENGKRHFGILEIEEYTVHPHSTMQDMVGPGHLHPHVRLIVVVADPAEVDRLRALHQLPLGAHTRRPWLRNQAALINPEEEGDPSDADQPRL